MSGSIKIPFSAQPYQAFIDHSLNLLSQKANLDLLHTKANLDLVYIFKVTLTQNPHPVFLNN